MPDEKRVPDSEDLVVSGTVTPEMLGVEGVVPEKPETPQPETMPEKEPEDVKTLRQELEQTRTELTELQSRSQQDMDALRSTLERGRHRELREKDRQLEEAEARMHEAAIRNMDEVEGMKYMQTVLEQKVQMYKDRATEAEVRSQAQDNMSAWARGFMGMGVKYDQLDFSSPEACVQSGYAALEQNRQLDLAKITEQENLIRQLQDKLDAGVTQPNKPVAPKTPEAPPTLGTQTGATPSQVKTMGQLLQSLEQQLGYKVTEDEMWSMVNSGQLPRTILTGLNLE